VIVRIATEGQFHLPDEDSQRLNDLDNQTVEERFTQLFQEMLDLVRRDGTPLGDDELEESDVILPPPDTTLTEAAHEFTGDGLIPD
jgi:hypothetical protein